MTTTDNSPVVGNVHSFESFATLDGEGIRYAVFFSGCPLRCIYCHNPDTWFGNGQVISPQQLLDKVLRYKPYFKTKGGVTFSGGEPLVQAKFICQMAELLQANNINYTLDTSGNIDLTFDVRQAIDNADMIILDLKFWDKDNYITYCGGDFDKVISFGDYVQQKGKKMWIRTVIIPNLNDNIDCIDKYISVAKRWNNVQKYELLGFHTMGFSKYKRLGLQNKLIKTNSLDSEVLKKLQVYLDKNYYTKS